MEKRRSEIPPYMAIRRDGRPYPVVGGPTKPASGPAWALTFSVIFWVLAVYGLIAAWPYIADFALAWAARVTEAIELADALAKHLRIVCGP